jgi:hypothetical protein
MNPKSKELFDAFCTKFPATATFVATKAVAAQQNMEISTDELLTALGIGATLEITMEIMKGSMDEFNSMMKEIEKLEDEPETTKKDLILSPLDEELSNKILRDSGLE